MAHFLCCKNLGEKRKTSKGHGGLELALHGWKVFSQVQEQGRLTRSKELIYIHVIWSL